MKTYLINYRSVVMHQYVIEADTKDEARQLFKHGEGRIAGISDFDTGIVVSIRVATQDDIASADLWASQAPDGR